MDREIEQLRNSDWFQVVRARFAFVDTDQDDVITGADLVAALGHLGLRVDRAWADAQLQIYDADHDGRVRFADYAVVRLLDEGEQEGLSGPLEDAFDSVDTDRDGRVSIDEMTRWYQARGLFLSRADVAARVAPWDADGDGQISLTEFLRMQLA